MSTYFFGGVSVKVQITLDDALMSRLDNYADENYLTRSGLVSLAVTQYLNQADVTKAIKDMAICMRKIADNGFIDDYTKKQLDEFEVICKMLIGK